MTSLTSNNEYTRVIDMLLAHGEVLTDVSMKQYTTFKTGGPADILVHPLAYDDMRAIAAIASESRIPLTVIGGGSNLLVGDGGIRGIVMRVALDDDDDKLIISSEMGTIRADARVKKSTLIQHCIGQGFSGVEFMAGIPGCLGGGIVMNAGTSMGCFADIITRVRYITSEGKMIEEVINRANTGYRSMGLPEGSIIYSAVFSLSPEEDAREIQNAVEQVVRERNQKHPVQFPSAGSVFKNPDGHASWKLINDAGLKGKSVGGAMVSDLHTNFIINTGNATSADIRNVIELVQDAVLKTYGIHLYPEVRMIGDFS
ncbi:MAG TPA: UDP-N-acetylmuramate dehydrogenase [Spirochaetota bacterium]|nr:UDP-N-acetylmuramate dehydrogenase [Spirochaetota bacterium]